MKAREWDIARRRPFQCASGHRISIGAAFMYGHWPFKWCEPCANAAGFATPAALTRDAAAEMEAAERRDGKRRQMGPDA